jgi:hypothetical protein
MHADASGAGALPRLLAEGSPGCTCSAGGRACEKVQTDVFRLHTAATGRQAAERVLHSEPGQHGLWRCGLPAIWRHDGGHIRLCSSVIIVSAQQHARVVNDGMKKE